MASDVRLGTSGYSYPWNVGKPSPFEWYLGLGFNTVEINASFYRFPVSAWTNTWMRAPDDFRFSIKVHRLITHRRRLGGDSVETLRRFQRPLGPLTGRIAFWLFQMPPSFRYSKKALERVTTFLRDAHLGASAVLEFRDASSGPPLFWSFGMRAGGDTLRKWGRPERPSVASTRQSYRGSWWSSTMSSTSGFTAGTAGTATSTLRKSWRRSLKTWCKQGRQ